ncbi:MAG: hypothetical protein PHG16_04120 [Lachnospiraceae bacterium]|nr:hypothetical protein [Lachnospiraceae bacterium]
MEKVHREKGVVGKMRIVLNKMKTFFEGIKPAAGFLEKNHLAGAFVLFLCMMLGFTVISRAAASFTVPQVTVVKPAAKVIEHRVSADGKVEQNLERAVFTEKNQIVEQVCVREGQQVAAQDVLFTLNLDQLKKSVEDLKKEIEKLQLGSQDALSDAQVAARQKENASARAREDYNTAAQSGDQAAAFALEELNRAEDSLNQFYNRTASAGEGEDALLQQLNQECEKKAEALSDAQAALSQLSSDATQEERDACEGQVSDAQGDLSQAQAAREAYQQQKDAQAQTDMDTQEAQLKADVAAKKYAYEEALRTREKSLVAAKRAIQDADAASASDSTVTSNQLDIDTKQKALEELQKVLDQEGKVTAGTDGVVTKLNIETGGLTAETSAVTLADLSSGTTFTAQITKEDGKYVSTGSEVTLKSSVGGQEVKGLQVTSVLPDEKEETLLDVTVALPPGSLSIGTTASMVVSQKSQSYPVCIPIQALHQDHNQYYVLILQEQEGVLGTAYISKRMEVTVLEKNTEYAALQEGSITTANDVIQSADREVSAGGTVRLA